MAKIVVLSGAGISAESGISTFRDSDGLWEEYDIKEVCTAGCLLTNRDKTIQFYDKRREELQYKQPNKAHWVLSELKERYKDEIAIITQNVDNLFEKADIAHEDVIHLHGYLREVMCEDCGLVYDIRYKKIQDSFNGKCPTCSSKKIRPNIVMFGEAAPLYAKLYKELEDCELLVIIGTSGNVIDVDSLTKYAKKSILNNLEPSDAIDDSLYTKVLYKKATDAIDEIAKEIKDTLVHK
jgi:NAD-dependent deacetylase